MDRNCASVYHVMGFRGYHNKDDVMRYLPKLDTFSDKLYKLDKV